ncbi:porin [Burkholderia stabilis]|uniref:Outer membrane porin protein BP0840,Outer membrane protein (Porin),Gram-negative porin n=1 Tax=Burkholderia stabilis TaxID=95485 RepID=A0AAJ5NGA2_9BURK|nr:porin [Burkholderia stabilis]VBB15547.1 Outer membrane porin protein BP0840 precursor,Outer membrane protein (porin),Gram-negative porin [Burkholderia stabilis]
MKKLLFALPLAAAATAHAQSSVTLYGIVEDGVDYVSNVQGKHLVQLASGVTAGSRWGVRGTEDLGGGLSTIFRLESGFDINSGRLGSGLAFSRNAYVGLNDAKLGTLTLGRQWDSIVDYVEPFTLNGNIGGYYFAHPNDMDNTDNGFPISNAVKYRSPTIAGVTFGGLYAFGGQPGRFSDNATFSVGASYAAGPVGFGIGYLRINNPGVSTQGYQNYPGFTNAIYGNYLDAARAQKVFGVGASYQVVQWLKVLADFTNTNFQQGSAGHDATFQNYEVSALVTPTPAVTIGTGYTYTTGRDHATNAEPKYHQFNLSVEYALSKRTSVYVMGAFQKAAGDAPVAQIAGFNPSGNQKQAVGRAGIRHAF